MHLCYVDESGNAEALLREDPNSTPVFVIVGVTIPVGRIDRVTWELLQLKKRYNPSLERAHFSELIQFEVKGATLRRDLRRPGRNNRRRAFGILDAVFCVLERNECQLLGRIIVKETDRMSRGDSRIYSRAIAQLAPSFQAQLAGSGTRGLMVLDARTKVKNAPSVLGVTTRRFTAGGVDLSGLVESPVFGHSDTHVPLQIVDLIASAVVFPIACVEHCSGLDLNQHPRPAYRQLKERYGRRLQRLEYRYLDVDGTRKGGFQVSDAVSHRPTHRLFRD